MGMRLSLQLMERSEWERCKQSKCTRLEDLNVQIVEDVVYDWCTDAFEDLYFANSVPRLTEQKLEEEEDIYVGVLDECAFLKLTEVIYNKAYAFKDKLNWKAMKTAMCKTTNKYQFGYAITWIDAYYNAIHIHKIVDWNKYVLYAEVG